MAFYKIHRYDFVYQIFMGTMSDNPIGRPTKMTADVVKKLEEAFLLGCSDVEACFYANISKPTLYAYQEANPDFADRKEALKNNPIFVARKSVVDKMADNGELALKYLERKLKSEFSTRTESEVTLNDSQILDRIKNAE